MTARLKCLSKELGAVALGDVRLNRRAGIIVDAWSLNPSGGLPQVMKTQAALEAAYRFLNNPKVTPDKVLRPHFEATCERVAKEDWVLVIHDTTEFGFGGETRIEIGRTNSSKAGFFAHASLALGAFTREPFGLVALKTWNRDKPAVPRKQLKRKQYSGKAPKEIRRWAQGVLQAEWRMDACAPGTRRVHVMDREGDQYSLIAAIEGIRSHYIIRSKTDRALAANELGFKNIRDAVDEAPFLLERNVTLSRRRRSYQNVTHNLPREERLARLCISTAQVTMKRPKGPENRGAPKTVTCNVVRVVEKDTPAGEEPVEWVLLTNLNIESIKDIETIIDAYRARWIVEEYFKAVKTGCSFEKLQLESYTALRNALALVLLVSWQMLLLRHWARSDTHAPASRVLTPAQLSALRSTPWTSLPPRPTVSDAFKAIAVLGGHIKNNGPPGWLVLYRGFRDLLLLSLGRSDQS